jgi:hypothetical protein
MGREYQGTEVFGRRPRVAESEPNRASGPKRMPKRNQTSQRPGNTLGVIALLASIVTIVLVIVGITDAIRGEYASSTGLAYIATGVSIVAVLGGLGAVLFDRGRGWGAVAIVLGLAANPVLLTKLLGWASGLG